MYGYNNYYGENRDTHNNFGRIFVIHLYKDSVETGLALGAKVEKVIVGLDAIPRLREERDIILRIGPVTPNLRFGSHKQQREGSPQITDFREWETQAANVQSDKFSGEKQG